MGKTMKRNQTSKRNKKESPKEPEKARNYTQEDADYFSRNYTNERIRKQIAEHSVLFKEIVCMLAFALFLILLSFIRAFMDIFPRISVYHLMSSIREDHPVGIAFGLTIIVMASVWIHEADSLCMIKHIFPACSGRRYQAKEIDDLANDPKTCWIPELQVFAAPQALIGFNKGITVVEYDDIAGIRIKVKEHSEKTTKGGNRGRMNVRRAMYFALTDKYREWKTYYIIIKTKKRKRMVLTEVKSNTYESLVQIIREKCKNPESIIINLQE